MRISGPCSYLVLNSIHRGLQHTVRITSDFSQVVTQWRSSTRVSPLFGVVEFGTEKVRSHEFKGEHCLFFLGPIRPDRILQIARSKYKLWLTLGMFNLVLAFPYSPSTKRRTINWAKNNRCRYEYWKIVNGNVVAIELSTERSLDPRWALGLKKILRLNLTQELRDLVEEYCSLVASAMHRSVAIDDKILNDFFLMNELVVRDVLDFKAKDASEAYYEYLLSLLTNLNAALSRFASQAFSGTSPIQETECHFWNHSLLGIGVANSALRNLSRFVQVKLAEVKIPQRFERLTSITDGFPSLTSLHYKDDYWQKDHIGGQKVVEASEPIIPLLTFFSARDGFKSTLTTLSAPLECVSACNSSLYSLMTITHEISHTIIRGVFGFFYPNFDNPQELERISTLIRLRQRPVTLMEEIRRSFAVAMIKMEDPGNPQVPFDPTPDNILSLFNKWHSEAEEIIVHVFDFLYFYGSNIEAYVADIWQTWSAIPNIENRISEYLIRTVCSAYAKNMRSVNGFDLSKQQVVEAMEPLLGKWNLHRSFAKKARDYLLSNWEEKLKPEVETRAFLINFTRAFLYSETIATVLLKEKNVSAHAHRRGGYVQKELVVDSKEIENPLFFVRNYTSSSLPSTLKSAWLMYCIAFNFKDG